MKIAVRYQTRGGNTQTVANSIAKFADVKAESIETPINGEIDLLFIGGGVYAWGLDKNLISFLENLDPKLVKNVAAFTTAGGMNKTSDIVKLARTNGINASEYTLPIKFFVKGHQMFGQAGKAVLNDKQENSICQFVKMNLETIL